MCTGTLLYHRYSTFLVFLRIVAARLNGSLDFFTVEINKPLGLLQYRGETLQLDTYAYFVDCLYINVDFASLTQIQSK